MTTIQVKDGLAHNMPADLRKSLESDNLVVQKWNSLTALAQNEWICWNVTVKQADTRKNHIQRTVTELKEGKRRPCCWMGCVHRVDKPMNASQKWILGKQKQSA